MLMPRSDFLPDDGASGWTGHKSKINANKKAFCSLISDLLMF
jgi:hypothetical protein